MTSGALRSADQAYRLGHGVGMAAADMYRVEIVAAVYLDRVEMLDESCRPRRPFDGPTTAEFRAEAGEFADDFEMGWVDGVRARCGDIIDRLNNNPDARLPVKPAPTVSTRGNWPEIPDGS